MATLRRSTLEKKGKRQADRSIAHNSPVHSSLVLAELSYQRGDIGKALQLLNRLRLQTKTPAFKEENLYGCSLGLSLETEKAKKVFEKLSRRNKRSGLFYEKARFNLGLVHLYHDLVKVGDMTITKQAMSGNTLLSSYGISSNHLDQAFSSSVQIWEDLLPHAKHYRNIILSYLSFAYLLKGDLQKSLDLIQESLSISRSFYVSHYVVGKLFLDFFFLTEDDINFSLPQETIEIFELEADDIISNEGDRLQVYSDTYMRVAHDAFSEGLQTNPNAPELYLGLIICYFFFGQMEDLYRHLSIVETMIPESKVLLDTVYWLVRESSAPPSEIKAVLDRLIAMKEDPSRNYVFQLIAPYFLI